jgi:predicted PurR-regulated permease PerM
MSFGTAAILWAGLAILVAELSRRRLLNEAYALIWLLGLLSFLAGGLGVFVVSLLVYHSVVLSRILRRTQWLAQRVALLQARNGPGREAQESHGREREEESQDHKNHKDKDAA